MASVLAIVPARAGSKGIPGKNLAMCAGKPLYFWSVEAALDASKVDYTVISTDIPEVFTQFDVKPVDGVEAWGRPVELTGDDTPLEPVIADVVSSFGHLPGYSSPDIIVLLQPTSPARTGAQIDEAVRMLAIGGYDSVLSVVPSHKFLWEGGEVPGATNYHPHARPNRQQMDDYEENGSIYAFTYEHWERTGNRLGGKVGLYEMPEECGYQIDTPLDMKIVEMILEQRNN
jgi:CMP-N,N'-diacetyllegionaminic acid synthase